jgi:hypothetical protein
VALDLAQAGLKSQPLPIGFGIDIAQVLEASVKDFVEGGFLHFLRATEPEE